MYHDHKYPVCVKSPFVGVGDGDGHSPLIGFALDGFPLYGPYVAKSLMAKDDTANPLDAFDMRYDDDRGWHYRVTPGKYPYLIGGFAGTPDPRSVRRGPPKAAVTAITAGRSALRRTSAPRGRSRRGGAAPGSTTCCRGR